MKVFVVILIVVVVLLIDYIVYQRYKNIHKFTEDTKNDIDTLFNRVKEIRIDLDNIQHDVDSLKTQEKKQKNSL